MKFKKIFASLALFASILTTSSCSLFGSDEGVMIERIESTSNSEGTTILTFYFTDEDQEPLVVEIPRGEQGIEGPIGLTGLGIEDITSRQSEDGKSTILTISFTSEDVPDKEIVVPNGVSVVEITSELDIENNTTVIHFTLSDGSIKDITVPNGKDGIGISNVEQTTDADNNIIITITYSDPSMGEDGKTTITIPYKNGEDGRGIATIVSTQQDNYYYLTIYYSDGTFEELPFIELPRINKWLTGYGAPNSIIAMSAVTGDYYFDLDNFVIYYFDGKDFIEIINLTEDNSKTKEYTVVFDPNGGRFINENTLGKIKVEAGSNINLASIPNCTMDGYSFEGYYTTKEGPLNPLSGKLTDLTPILSDITFYAHYEKI